MAQRTDRYQLVEAKLGEELAEWVARRRRPDIRPPAAWRDIATELSQQTGIAVSYETLRIWFTDDQPTAQVTA